MFNPDQEQDLESTLRCVNEPIKNFKGAVKTSALMLFVVKQNGID